MEVKLFSVTWSYYLDTVKKVVKELRDAWDPTPPLVWGIPRGGAIVAATMAYWGCILAPSAYTHNVIIVDDIIDTGKTLEDYREHNGNEVVFASLFVRFSCPTFPAFWGEIIETDEYVVFPYEDVEEVVKQITEKQSYRTNDGGVQW